MKDFTTRKTIHYKYNNPDRVREVGVGYSYNKSNARPDCIYISVNSDAEYKSGKVRHEVAHFAPKQARKIAKAILTLADEIEAQ